MGRAGILFAGYFFTPVGVNAKVGDSTAAPLPCPLVVGAGILVGGRSSLVDVARSSWVELVEGGGVVRNYGFVIVIPVLVDSVRPFYFLLKGALAVFHSPPAESGGH